MSGVAKFGERPMTIREFLGFYEKQPDGEHWELIDGTPHMMTPPVIRHQIIAGNLEIALAHRVAAMGLSLVVVREVGIEMPGMPGYRPEPELTVIDADYDVDRRYVDRFHLVVEVLSPSDRRTLAKKLAFYRGHPDCHTIVLVEATEVSVTVHRRAGDGWRADTLVALDDVVETGFGPLGTLRDVYARTPLAR
jgi:Uma2 family endonuclease